MAERGFADPEVLEIFVESVDELLNSGLLAQVKTDGISTQLGWSHDTGLLSQRTGQKRDAVKAFLLTLRLRHPCMRIPRSVRVMASLLAAARQRAAAERGLTDISGHRAMA